VDSAQRQVNLRDFLPLRAGGHTKGFSMKNFLKLFGIIALIAVIGFSMAGCKNDDENDGTDPILNETDSVLNGIWVQTVIGNDDGYTYIVELELKLNNGSFEASGGIQGETLSPIEKGTYTTSGNSMTLQATHYHYEGNWRTKDQLKSIGVSDGDIDVWFASHTGIWSVSGSTLTLGTGTDAETFSRKN